MHTAHRKRKRRTRQEVEDLMARFHQSGQKVSAFARSEGVAESAIYYWLKRERETRPAAELVEVKLASETGGRFTLRTPGGYRIEVPSGFRVEELKRLLLALDT